MARWHRTETRVVRPFESVEACLAGVRFRLSPEADFDERTSFDVSEVKSTDIAPEFRLSIDQSALESLGSLSPPDLSLVVRLADSRLRRSELVFESGLESLPETWAVPPDVRNRFSWKSGVDASVAVVLRSERPPGPGQPFMPGHWVARKDFSVRAKAAPRALSIERWTAEDFVREGLPRDSVYWIQFVTDDLNSQFNDPGEAFRVCLRADVYDSLVGSHDTRQGRAVMSLIAGEILTEVLWRGLRNLGDGEEIVRGGLLHAAVARVRKATNSTDEVLRRLAADDELSTLRAFVQAALGVRRHVARLGVMQ
ncbi:MAG: hypothetical protein KatS3mg015_2577 [Fimbriimonadales bacterium]|nr:MAG: hypothetical protein KatS3mg015_2577 [Fimbriimonadales bacterium]